MTLSIGALFMYFLKTFWFRQWWDSNFSKTGSLTTGLANNTFSHYHNLQRQTMPTTGSRDKEIPRTGSCKRVESHHWVKVKQATFVV